MTAWLYLAFGFSLLSIFLDGEKKGDAGHRLNEIGRNSLLLTLILGIVFLLDYFLTRTLWPSAGRNDLRWISVAASALVVEGGVRKLARPGTFVPAWPAGRLGTVSVFPLSFLAAVTISLWTLSTGSYLLGLTLPLGIGLSEGLLLGLWERLRLSNPPALLDGAPLLFWLTMLLALAVPVLTGTLSG